MAATHSCKEVVFFRRLSTNVGFDAGQVEVQSDSQSVICLVKNPTYHAKSKHIDVQFHFVHDMVEDGKVILNKVDTQENVVDASTKPVALTSSGKEILEEGPPQGSPQQDPQKGAKPTIEVKRRIEKGKAKISDFANVIEGEMDSSVPPPSPPHEAFKDDEVAEVLLDLDREIIPSVIPENEVTDKNDSL
ncbi:uncharacterized protein LOC131875994 [Cryptomeria japonica]|uniref:uncharacterized protein LOC131875994 n=1 Tax=Cryptomeria japonica TaxID=3369 RepID=UPI0027DA4461|nr:uncharacterized protein LOC131875994 [Cryptomeria japonica]